MTKLSTEELRKLSRADQVSYQNKLDDFKLKQKHKAIFEKLNEQNKIKDEAANALLKNRLDFARKIQRESRGGPAC